VTSTALVELLLAEVGARRGEVTEIGDLGQTLAGQLADIAAAWPTLVIDSERYTRRLANAIARRGSEPAARVIASMPAADLYLAAACTAGDAAALDVFRATLLPALRGALRKLGAPDATIAEAEQRVLVMLFVGDAPQIAGYSGRGRLLSWVRSISVRTGRRLMGTLHGKGGGADDELDELPAAVRDPELELLRTRYVDQVRSALAAAFADLGERPRRLLRQHHIDGLTIDALAPLYRVNRATTARWVAAARRELLDGIRGRLIAEHGVPSSEVDSVIRIVRSQLSLSIRGLG
jgi:RNA polymerase sigma-70 factor (ECF subfamily)